MAKSHVFKDQSGSAAGYLLQAGGKIRIRASSGGDATLLFDDGTTQVHGLCGSRDESVFPDAGKTLIGAYVQADGVLQMYTDERAKTAHAENEKSVQHRVKETASGQPASDMQTVERVAPEEKHVLLPQPRWPPPLCWEAEYVQGEWRSQDESGKDSLQRD